MPPEMATSLRVTIYVADHSTRHSNDHHRYQRVTKKIVLKQIDHIGEYALRYGWRSATRLNCSSPLPALQNCKGT